MKTVEQLTADEHRAWVEKWIDYAHKVGSITRKDGSRPSYEEVQALGEQHGILPNLELVGGPSRGADLPKAQSSHM